MKQFLFLAMLGIAFLVSAQTTKIGGGVILAAPAPEDSVDRKVYVPPVPACTVIYYPVIRESVRMGKGDKIRLILRSKPKDSATFKELWQWDYKATNLINSDTITTLIKANIVP